jgi:hypothetical protein
MENEIIIGLSMGLMNVLKKFIPEKFKELLPFICLIIIVIANVIVAYATKQDIIKAVKDSIINGGVTLGLFTTGTLTARALKNITYNGGVDK